MSTAIKVENLSKAYQLGQFSTGTLSRDIERKWARIRGKEDPFLSIGESNDREQKGTSNVVWSLKDLNFEIMQGDAIGVIGRNGAGKSTLLKLLSRVTSPTTGSIKIKGRIASLLEVGTGFHPELTGKENIYLNGAILGMRKKEISRKFDEIVDFSGVERYIDTPVKRYSSGMYVRLAFAVAAHLESEILIVDEVLAVGDAEFQKKCLGKMGDISKGEGRTLLFVSHNLQAISSICEKGIILKNGELHTNADITTCVNNYLSLTKDFSFKASSSLKDRLNRSSGEIQFTKVVCVKDDEESSVWTYTTEEEIKFEIDCQVNENCNNGLTFYIAFKELMMGSLVTNIKEVLSVGSFRKGENLTLSLVLPANSFRPGQYELYLALGDKDRPACYDIIDNNISLPSLIIMPVNYDAHLNAGIFTIPYSLEMNSKPQQP